MLFWCVPGFVFISGWYGIRFSFGKMARLYGISFYCAALFVAFDAFFSGCSSGVWGRIYGIATGQWFLNAYAVLMCIAPMVNQAVEKATSRELLPLLFCVFIWSFSTTMPIVGRYVPQTSGLTAYSFLTLLGVYSAARFARKSYDANGRFKRIANDKRVMWAFLAVCLPLAAIGFNEYNSPFALLIAGCVFLMIKGCHMPRLAGRVCAWLGPSMFSVYLMHSHGHAWRYVKAFQDGVLAHGAPLVIGYLLTAFAVFAICVIADMPRRCFTMMFKRGR